MENLRDFILPDLGEAVHIDADGFADGGEAVAPKQFNQPAIDLTDALWPFINQTGQDLDERSAEPDFAISVGGGEDAADADNQEARTAVTPEPGDLSVGERRVGRTAHAAARFAGGVFMQIAGDETGDAVALGGGQNRVQLGLI